MHLLAYQRPPLPDTLRRSFAQPHRHAERIEVPRVDYEKLSGDRLGESSAKIRERVQAARERQQARFAGASDSKDTDAVNLDGHVPL